MCITAAQQILKESISRKIRCLILDSDGGFRHTVERVLRDLGLEVFGTDNTKAGVDLHCQQPFDVLVVQWGNEHYAGFYILEEIRRKSVFVPKTIIVVSDEIASLVFPFEVSAIIFKPFEPGKLILAIQQAIGGGNA